MPDDEAMERRLRAYRPAEPRPEWLDSLSRTAVAPSLPWLDLACAAMLVLSLLAGLATGRVQARMEALARSGGGVGSRPDDGSRLAGHVATIALMAREVDR